MGLALAALQSFPWTSLVIPLAYQRAAAELDEFLHLQSSSHFARGFQSHDECVVALTADSLVVGVAKAFLVRVEQWPLSSVKANFRIDEDRVVIELRGPGRRSLLRLLPEAATQELLRQLDERLHPRDEISFTRYA